MLTHLPRCGPRSAPSVGLLSRGWETRRTSARSASTSATQSVCPVSLLIVAWSQNWWSRRSRNLVRTGGTRCFGVDLADQLKIEGSQVPKVIVACVEAVEKRGMDVQGIYRVSGANSQTTKLREAFIHGKWVCPAFFPKLFQISTWNFSFVVTGRI